MKGLVLLYRSDNGITIKEYPKVEENNLYYIVGNGMFNNKEGIMKKYVGKMCTFDCYGAICEGSYVSKYPIDIPYMGGIRWRSNGCFMFINKVKYDANPLYYYDMIKHFRED